MGVQDRLMQFLEFKNLSKLAFANSIGRSPSYVTNMVNSIGRSSRKVIQEKYPELNMDWLINGEGEMIVIRSEEDSKQQEPQSTDSSVLVVPLTAHAGNLSQFTRSVYEYECERILSPIKGADFAVPVSGESMSPEYPSGSKVLVTKINEKAFIDWGKTYVLDTCNGVIIKNVYPSENEGFVKCVSVNPLYPPFELNIEDVYGWYKVLMCLAIK